ncbi:5-bromo-4-chloroindolyl phosphate hydrolysis family protein [Clostridium sp. DL1XJH146]
MHKKDFPYLEDQIKETVKNALDAIDFVTIKKNISGKADNTIDSVKINLKNKSQQFNEKMEKKTQNKYNNIAGMNRNNRSKDSMYINKMPSGRILGIIYTILGTMGIGVMSILLFIFFIIGLLENFKVLGILLTFLGLNIALLIKGKSLRKRVKRFNRYVNSLDGENYCSIKQLSMATGKKNKFVVKDLRKMIDKGMFKEAYINEEKTYFMLSNEVYDNYLITQQNLKKRNEQQLKKDKINDPEKEELMQTIEMVKNYIEQIKNVNRAISKEEISIKLQRLQNIVSEIINFVEKNPKKLVEVRKFTTHYLPITLKLVNGYKDLNDQPVEGDNIKNAKNEIEKSIDIINIAFEKLLDDLFEDLALDVSTDISVLETLFKQEGLTKNDFESK